VFAWTVGVSLVFLLLLIWSALIRDSAWSRSLQAEHRSGQPGRSPAAAPLGHSPECGAPGSDGPSSDGPSSGEPGSDGPASGPAKTYALAEAGAPDTATSSAEIAARHAAGK
jgi:hypothetical protein